MLVDKKYYMVLQWEYKNKWGFNMIITISISITIITIIGFFIYFINKLLDDRKMLEIEVTTVRHENLIIKNELDGLRKCAEFFTDRDIKRSISNLIKSIKFNSIVQLNN